MKYQLIMVAALLSGCATSEPFPALVGNNYYMGGDANCVRYDQVSPTRIRCTNAKREMTGYRDAMTPQQVQAYAAMNQYQPPRYSHQPQVIQPVVYPVMQTPRVANLTPGSNQVRCISTGIYTNCR